MALRNRGYLTEAKRKTVEIKRPKWKRSDESPAEKFMEELYKVGYGHPFIRDTVMLFKGEAMVELKLNTWEDDKSVHFSGVMVLPDFRGQGFGRKAVELVQKLARKHGVRLTGSVSPYGSTKGLNKRQLHAWYKRLGFKRKKIEIDGRMKATDDLEWTP